MSQSAASRAGATRSPDDVLFESLYLSLRALAQMYLRRERPSESLSPTVLVHDAYLVLAKSRSLRSVKDSEHMLRLVSRKMKNLLIDRARYNNALVHGGNLQRVECEDTQATNRCDRDTILEVATAVDRLRQHSTLLARIVELRYFCGFTEEEVAQILQISARSVRRNWVIARLRLLEFMQN